jgi:hypothetical protein
LRPLADQIAVVSATVLFSLLTASCMRIYPDPDLPDIKVEWQAECAPNSTVDVELVPPGESPKGEVAASAPCADQRMIVPNVERARLRVVGVLHEVNGAVVSQSSEEVDTSDGNNKHAFLFFEGAEFGRLALAWRFAAGDTCASVGAVNVEVTFSSIDMTNQSSLLSRCDVGRFDNELALEAGVYSMQPFAVGITGTRVAFAPPRSGVVIAGRGVLTDLGTVELRRCDASCEPRPAR